MIGTRDRGGPGRVDRAIADPTARAEQGIENS